MLEMQPKPGASRRVDGRRRALIVAALVALCCGWLIRRSTINSRSQAGDGVKRGLAGEDGIWPKVRAIAGLETLWEVPSRTAKGVLFVAHGCKHQGSDFWPSSPRCRHCLGLPEEVRVQRAAVARGYAVVAVTSFNRSSGCWQNTLPAKSEDLKRLPSILREVMEEEGLGKLPLLTFGASSGGSMALRLAAIMPEVKGTIAQITPVKPHVLAAEGGRAFPPALFVHMAQRDPGKAKMVAEALRILKEAGSPAAEINIAPQAVTPQFLQRSAQVDERTAKAIVVALEEGGALDEGGFLVRDPRSGGSQWRQLVAPVAGNLSLQSDVSQITELLNVAWARHEITSDHFDACLDWLEAGGKERLRV